MSVKVKRLVNKSNHVVEVQVEGVGTMFLNPRSELKDVIVENYFSIQDSVVAQLNLNEVQ